MSQTEAASAEPSVPPDPIYQRTYSVHVAVASVALVGSVALAIADEVWLRRPYKGIQRQWVETYGAYLDRLVAERSDVDAVIGGLDEILAAQAAVEAAGAAAAERSAALSTAMADLDAELTVLTKELTIEKSEISALTYEAEHHAHAAGDADASASEAARHVIERIDGIKRRPKEYVFQLPSTSQEKSESGTVGALIEKFLALQARKAALLKELGEVLAPRSELQKRLDELLASRREGVQAYLKAAEAGGRKTEVEERIAAIGPSRFLDESHTPLSADVLRGIRGGLDEFPTSPLLGGRIQEFQIHVKDGNNWVDRCQVCHLGALQPVPVTAEGLRATLGSATTILDADGNEKATFPAMAAAKLESYPLSLFASHPRAAALFSDHDPETVACSMCHSGNGVAIGSEVTAHGRNKDWLWPLYGKEHSEAGCIQCHQQDLHLATGPAFTRARETFLEKGCWGCHPYAGHNPEPEAIAQGEGRIRDIDAEIARKRLRIESLQALLNALPEGDAFTRAAPVNQRERDTLQEEVSALLTERRTEDRRVAGHYRERIRVGPNLKDVKAKLRPEFLTAQVQDPTHWRPESRMPVFRWWGTKDGNGYDEEAKDVAAFLWQSALDPAEFPELRLSAPQGGSIARGKQLFEQVGCLGCHSTGSGDARVGANGAANLSNLGDKATYEYVFRWIKDPRNRIVPWSRTLRRDLTKAEWEREDPATLVWSQHARMPNFRLSDDEARDVATYLVSQRSGMQFPEPKWLTEKERFDRGRDLVRYQGCAGCHEIRGLEQEKGIGRDLTNEGSQPLDRLDYGHLTIDAQRGKEPLAGWRAADGAAPFEDGKPWYRPRGFFLHKLAEPDIWDTSKYFPDQSRLLRLRMPKFRLTGQELTDLTTFLLGSVDAFVPEKIRHRPDERGQAIREGWWVVKKYDCYGCHAFAPEEVPPFQRLPWFADAKFGDAVFPPTLVGEGFRARPEWIAKFLRDPSLGGGTAQPKSLRPHLGVRMPTFDLSEDEISKLVRFFQAQADQLFVHVEDPLPPLTAEERATAELIFKDSNCIQCHVSDQEPAMSGDTKATNLSHAGERLQAAWTRRWLENPKAMQPRTSMLIPFEWDAAAKRWFYPSQTNAAIQASKADHLELTLRYVLSIGHAPNR